MKIYFKFCILSQKVFFKDLKIVFKHFQIAAKT